MSLQWQLRRLSAMSAAEVGYRVSQRVHATFEQWGWHRPRPQLLPDRSTGKAWVEPLPQDFDANKYRVAADRILDGESDVFALRPARLGFPPRWNRDPKTGTEAPLRYGKTLDYRKEALVGDIKYLWEPARHAQLVTLAQAWHLTRDSRYAVGCRTLLDSWFEQCPYGLGPHWTSSLELALRLVNWSFAWHLLGAEQSILFREPAGVAFRERWLTSIHQHCHFISGHLSRHSSANNHLLGELTGLFIAAVTWPLWDCSDAWRAHAQAELESAALLQNTSDGVNAEQAIWYHHEVADMMLVAGLVARANGDDFGDAYWQRLESMLGFIASIMDCGGYLPSFGDADDAIVAPLDPALDRHVYRSLLATGAVLFRRHAFQAKARAFDDKTRWLLGDQAHGAAKTGDADELPKRRFDQGGYYVLGERFETPQEVRAVADAGPLGYLSIAAHGHADALSFTLNAAGRELLIDPGTFAYHTHQRWRDYFRGTLAHNTVRVDRQDQSVNAGNFLWLAHAAARLLAFDVSAAEQRWQAEHDGYLRLKDPVRHRRALRFSSGGAMEVRDELLCRGAHEIELCWNFSERCEVRLEQGVLIARNGPVTLRMTLPAAHWELVQGRESPPAGWRSLSFDTRIPIVTAIGNVAIRGETTLVTEMQVLTIARSSSAGRSAAAVPSHASE